MILPIHAYGDPILKKTAIEVNSDYASLNKIISDMYETMYQANGIGLAAPQVGFSIRVFIVDATPFVEDENYQDIKDELSTFKKVFINPIITERTGELFKFNEGCLSIPDIHEDVSRYEKITLEYYDENWNKHTEIYGDIRARIIQHEYDHLEGILFTELLSPLKKKLIKGKLNNIQKGNINPSYKMKFIN